MLELTLNGKIEVLPDEHLDEAMRRFWIAKESGDSTANVARARPTTGAESGTGLPTLATRPEAIATVPSEAMRPTTTGTISPLARERVAEQERQLTASGFALPPPVYAAGTRVIPLGDENFRIERARIEALPRFVDAAASIQSRVASEEREDVPVSFADLRLDSDGLLIHNGDSYRVESDAFSQLCAQGGFGCGARYLSECCPAPLRATNVNDQVAGLQRRAVLRTRLVRGRRNVFAVVSPSYAAVDGATALGLVLPALADARTELVYDGRSTVATALWMPDHIVDLSAGDVFKAGVRIQCDDTGRGRIRIAAVVWRNLCLNLIIVAEGESEVASVVHRGDPERILSRLPAFIETARTKIADFLDAWKHARTLKLDVRETFEHWLDLGSLSVRGTVPCESVIEALVRAWRKEPGDTLADAVNAVTRAAHETLTWSHEIQRDLERQAGVLIHVRR